MAGNLCAHRMEVVGLASWSGYGWKKLVHLVLKWTACVGLWMMYKCCITRGWGSQRRWCFHWDRPSVNWVKVNCDGSWNPNIQHAGAGGVIRNSNENWISGFEVNCENCAIERAELWDIRSGLQLAWDLDLRKVELESDSATSIDMISKGVSSRHPSTIWYFQYRSCY